MVAPRDTFGRARLTQNGWVIEADAHVMVKLKRLFAQIASYHSDKVRVSDTPDVARDLEWFMTRYPLVISRGDQMSLKLRLQTYKERQSLVTTFRAGKLESRTFTLAEPPYEFQRSAAEFFLQRKALLLGDDMGLGKTITTICALTDPKTRPALVVGPRSVGRQWVRQIKRFAPSLRVHHLKTGSPTREDIMPNGELADVIVSTYAKLPGWASLLKDLVKMVAFDEAQELRNGTKTKKGAAAKLIAAACEYKLMLTGTPIYNLGGEFYHVLEFIFPGALGTRSEFLLEHCGGEDSRGRAGLRDPKAFGDYIRREGLMLRRTRADVKRELPGLTVIPHAIESDPEALRDIESAAMRLARIIIEGTGTRTEQFTAREELSVMVRKATGVAKAPYVAELVNMILESEQKVVLFGHHHDVYGIWRERLKDHEVVMFTGQQTDKQKADAEDAFVRGDARVLIMGVRMAAGVDGLQHVCRTGIIGEPDYSPGVHEQCYTRLHRDGQKDPVTIYVPLAEDGSDPIIADILQVKRAQLEGIRNVGGDIMEHLESDGSSIRKLAEFYLAKAKQRKKQ